LAVVQRVSAKGSKLPIAALHTDVRFGSTTAEHTVINFCPLYPQ
jgi:hypothetical protein